MGLKLVMIVKDEAAGIAATLRSARPFIDSWCILDTGSTDGTQAIIEAELSEIPGQLHHGLFIDFAVTRNQALELAGTDSEYLLLLNGDDVVESGDRLTGCPVGPERQDAYHVTIVEKASRYKSARVVRAAAGWRFHGVTHEVLMGPAGEVCVADIPITVRQDRPPQGAEKQRRQWERDLALLTADLQENPENSRSRFYLAQTYRGLGMKEAAAAHYYRRISLDGWQEEVFASFMAIAELSRNWDMAFARYVDAHQHSPHRAEPLCAIAAHYIAISDFITAFRYARRAYELPYPAGDILFVNTAAYEWWAADLLGACAYHVGAFAIGEAAARKAVEAQPDDERLRRNLQMYIDRHQVKE